MSRYVISIVEGPATRRDVEVPGPLDVRRKPPQDGLTLDADEQVSRHNARLTPPPTACSQWELHSVPLSLADNFDPGEWSRSPSRRSACTCVGRRAAWQA